MTEEELKQIQTAASDAAKKACAEYAAQPNETTKALEAKAKAQEEQVTKLLKEVEAGKAEAAVLQGQIMRIAKSSSVSLVEMGAGKSELNMSKAKYFKGLITNQWVNADKEFDIYKQVQKLVESNGESQGANAIPVELSTNIVELVRERDVFRELGCMMITPQRLKFEVPVVKGGSSAFYVGEASAIDVSNIKFGVISLDPKRVAAIVPVSRVMLDAADPSFVPMVERDLAGAISEKRAWGMLYGNLLNETPLGLANNPDIHTYQPGDNGDDPTKDFLRKIRSTIDEKYASNPSFQFLFSRKIMSKIASNVSSSAPETSVLLKDSELALRATDDAYKTSGLVRSDKTKGSGTYLGDLFYGAWNEFISADWWGGLRIENTMVGGNAWRNDCYEVRAVLPHNSIARRPDVFVHAPFVKTILSAS